MILIAVGAHAFWHGCNLYREFTHMHAQSMTDLSAHERASLWRKDDAAAYRFFIHLPIAGLLAAVPGAVIRIVLVAMLRLECRVAL